MADFCGCGSIKVNGACSNRKCSRYGIVMLATFEQIEYIKSLKERLDEDTDDIAFIESLKTMTRKEASNLIEELKERLVE